MAATVAERIVAKIAALLSAEGKPEGLTVDRERQRAVDAAQLPQMSVYPVREEAQRVNASRMSRATTRTLTVEIRYRAAGDSTATDALRQWAVKQIMADPSLGGLVRDVEESTTDWDTEEGEAGKVEAAKSAFDVKYATKSDDLAALI